MPTDISDELQGHSGSYVDDRIVVTPSCFSKEIRFDRNRVRQMLLPSGYARVDMSTSTPCLVRSDGSIIRLIAGTSGLQPDERALRIGREGLRDPVAAFEQPNRVRWVGNLLTISPIEVRETWVDSLNFVLEARDTGRSGLRLPQLGALHAVLGYWTTGSMQPATVVMPTGTGKTETMIAILVAERPQRLLVVVPSDVLRSQLVEKFESFGVLQENGVIAVNALCPVVGQLKHAFSTIETACDFAAHCNVIVATPQALFASSPEVTQALLDTCSHLFVDEAHHVEAATWRRIRDAFEGKRILQFTATPFREDGRRIAGQIIYSFPLRQAQKHNYFSKINYVSVVDFENPDRAIADRAIKRLRDDLAAGFDHLMMARVKRIGRARELLELYLELAPDLSPVILHSSLPARDRRLALQRIHSRDSRVIICVNMLGEGFDLPSLKVAAIHDLHKSLGVTLQFIGRFARVAGIEIGEASVVTGRPEGRYDENLRRLYAEEPDWNYIIQDLSEIIISKEYEVSEFEAAFGTLPEEVSMRNIQPKLSTVVYCTNSDDWQLRAIYDLYPEDVLYTDCIAVNEQNHVAWFILKSHIPVCWGDIETVADISYDLYILYWNESRQLLYINSSNNDSVHKVLAKAVCGCSAELISGEDVFRVMAGVKRLVPTNVGLLDVRNLSRRFSMHVGADVIEGFPVAQAQTKTKTNIFAYGYENGERVSIGGSLKGRIWSYRVAPTIKHWTDWCDHIGAKVSDSEINLDEVMRGFIRPKVVDRRPPYVALGLEWPWEVFMSLSEETRVERNGVDWPLIDIDMVITEFLDCGPIMFDVMTPDWKTRYAIDFEKGQIIYRLDDATEAEVVTRGSRIPLSDYFEKYGLSILFDQDAMVVPPGVLLKPDRELPPFDPDKLIVLDWSGVNIGKESQGPSCAADSIQAYVIDYVRGLGKWEIIIDDDGTGEVADIVAMRVDGEYLVVTLVHCKYSSNYRPGRRVGDLYEVCGQTQKSIRWRRDREKMFATLIRHERDRIRRQRRSGLIVGDGNALYRLAEHAYILKPDFRVFIAQPGLSKGKASNEQLEQARGEKRPPRNGTGYHPHFVEYQRTE